MSEKYNPYYDMLKAIMAKGNKPHITIASDGTITVSETEKPDTANTGERVRQDEHNTHSQ